MEGQSGNIYRPPVVRPPVGIAVINNYSTHVDRLLFIFRFGWQTQQHIKITDTILKQSKLCAFEYAYKFEISSSACYPIVISGHN